MRKTRALVAVAFVLLVTPMLMGATVTFTAVNPNPNKKANTLAANGKYTLANTDKPPILTFIATIKNTTQMNFVGGVMDGKTNTWTATMVAGPATYNPCNVYLDYVDVNGKPQTAKDVNIVDQVVK